MTIVASLPVIFFTGLYNNCFLSKMSFLPFSFGLTYITSFMYLGSDFEATAAFVIGILIYAVIIIMLIMIRKSKIFFYIFSGIVFIDIVLSGLTLGFLPILFDIILIFIAVAIRKTRIS